MKRVLMLGDSIREHCQIEVQEMLKDEYVVHFPWENGRFAAYTFNRLRDWFYNIPAKELDVIHWNNGLWDIGRQYGEDRGLTDIDTYIDYMDRIFRVLKQETNAKIVLATTTPTRKEKETMPASQHFVSDIMRYNEALVKHFEGKVDAINDLFSFVMKEREAMISDDFIHPNEYGRKKIAAEMCRYIKMVEKN